MPRLWFFGRTKANAATSPKETHHPDPDAACIEESSDEVIDPGNFQAQQTVIPPGFNPYSVWDTEARHRAGEKK